MPILSSKLPKYSGQYDVGTIDIEIPCNERVIDPVVLKETGKPAFQLKTILFSLYYPSTKGAASRRPLHPWVPKPLALQAEGYARFAKINNWLTNHLFLLSLWALVGHTEVPANVDVPLHGTANTQDGLADGRPVENETLSKFPIIVFSHGMASGRTSYTQYCGELASRGFIVAAVEHRDGSGPGTTIMDKKGVEHFYHVNSQSLEPEPDHETFKKMQLSMRQAEVDEVVRVLRLLDEGKGKEIASLNSRAEGTWLAEWKNRLDFSRMAVGGHSFGATLALQTLRPRPDIPQPFVGAIVLDPGKSSGPLNGEIDVPVLVVHSQSWSKKYTIFHGAPHFSTVKSLVQNVIDRHHKCAWFATARGTTHPSVTDAPLIEPFLLAWTTGATIDAREGLLQYVQISQQFMQYIENGQRTGVLKENVTHPEFDAGIEREIQKEHLNTNIEQYWQIHVAPSTSSISTATSRSS